MRILSIKSDRIRKGLLAAAIAVAGAFGLWSCQLGQDPKVEDVASFDKLYDSLAQYDSVVIIFNDANGNFLDTVFQGKVDSHEKIRNLPVQGWDGKKAKIIISGFDGGQLVYQIEKKFDGTSNEIDANILLIAPGTALACEVRELTMTEGDSLGIPTVTVTPAALNDRTVLWTSSDPAVLTVGADFLKAQGRGRATLIGQLRSDTSKSLRIPVTVVANGRVPDSLYLQPDTLRLAAEGSAGQLSVRVFPSSADAGVTWKVGNTAVATVSADGAVQGLKAGQTLVWALSKLKAGLSDSSLILVSAPIPVEAVRFLKNPVSLYVGGASDSLAVAVLPAQANPEVLFTVADPTVVLLKDNRITGLAAGRTRIVARSKAYPDIADTLQVTVLAGHPVEKVVIADKSVGPAYVGGPLVRFSASVLPADAPQQIQWKIPNGTVAAIDDSGRVTGRSPGVAVIYAVSLADSSKKDSAVLQVKRDMPQLNAGRDTVVSLGATVSFAPTAKKESGTIVAFKWDLDGDLAWDDSSAAMKTVSRKYDQEKEYTVRFYVRDSQGNDTLATLKVKVVKGLVVLIQSPLDNSYTNKSPVKVLWTVDGRPQDTLPLEVLREGANVLTRTAKDSAGTAFSATVTVNYDITAPNKPLVHGTALVATTQPTWTWSTGGSAGSGSFRYSLDAETFANPETKDTLYTPAAPLPAGVHTLYVQERDAAGNWSLSGQFATTIDLTPPGVPKVRVNPAGATNNTKPTWTWASGGGTGQYQSRLDVNDFSALTASAADTAFTPATALAEGTHILYVREKGAAGNWSVAGSAEVTVDLKAPTSEITTSTTMTGTAAFTLAGKASDAGAGVAKVMVSSAQATIATGDAILAADGTWTKGGITLVPGANTLDAIATDKAGNISTKVSLTVTLDNVGPVLTITPVPSPTSTAALTVSGTASDAVSGVEKVTVSSTQASVAAGDAIISGTTWSKSGITLVEGSNTISVTATDKAGKTTTASIMVTLDTTPSGNPTGGSVVSPTSSKTPTFTWKSGGGNGTYRVRMDVDNFTTGYTEIAVASYTPPTAAALSDGSHKLYVRETDGVGNWSGSLAIDVVVDATKPILTVTGGAGTIASINTTLLFTATDAGTGISGTPSCKLGTKVFSVTQNGTSWSCAVTGLASGANTVNLDALDGVGNPGSAAASITVNVPVPKVNIMSPVNNFVTNNPKPTITYMVDDTGSVQTYLPLNNLSEGANEITIESPPNAVGVKGNAKITIYLRGNVIFVGPTAKGAGDGSSWDDVTAGLYATMTKVANIGKEIWVDAGTYSTASTKWVMVNDLKIYGGFNGSSHPNSNALSNRPSKSKVTGTDFTVSDNGNVTIDGFTFSGTFVVLGTTAGNKITVANSEIVDQSGAYSLSTRGTGEILLEKVVITKNTNTQGTVLLGGQGSKLTMTGGEITENTVSSDWGKIVDIQAGAVVFTGGLQVSGNVVTGHSNYYQVWIADQEMSPSLDVVPGVTLGLEEIYVYQYDGIVYGCLRYHGTIYGMCSGF